MAYHLGLEIEPSKDSFTFMDCSQRNSGGIIRNLEVQIGNAPVPVDFHVLDIKLNWISSLLLGRAFMATVGAVFDMQTNKLCLTLIDPNVYYDPELDNGASIDTQPKLLIDGKFKATIDSPLEAPIDTNSANEIYDFP
ncbi:hypothetical protein DY000_02022423 [Brassica cretica]|uniref:Xylanase inhibitor C-terminal domain-containing protein n=1 Tax=Brassica cretica TaxID=69181 RepID=A0ABQ7E1H1_BRACR|nr:hypothetical protein DY000_02022423 [Brassica cretica]